MAEESPRPGTEEDSEEEGEEAAQAPARGAPLPPARLDEESDDEEAACPGKEEASPPPPAGPPASTHPSSRPSLLGAPRTQTTSRPPLLGAAPAFPAYPQAPSLYYSHQPAAFTAPAAASTSGVNHFANDGSFLELFKKKMESGGQEESKAEEEDRKPEPEKRRPVSFVGKRRGGAKLALKTGMVAKKPKSEDDEVLSRKGGAWAQYMAEVKKYKAHQCSDDDKTRPLVK